MSKTWSRSEKSVRRSARHVREVVEGGILPAPVERPPKVTAAWAVERMAQHIKYELERMISFNAISVADKEDYTRRINRRIVKAVPVYKREVSQLKPGSRTASPVHYFTVVVDYELNMIRRFLERLCRNADERPISFLPPEEAQRFGYISAETLSDECKNIRDLEFRMDVNTLRGMMTPLEIEIFDERMAGRTYDEIAGRLGFNRFKLARIMANLQKRARICSMFPHRAFPSRAFMPAIP